MPRIVRARDRGPSPARVDNSGVSDHPCSSRSRRSLKRTASQALPPTPPRTVKRERKSRVSRSTHAAASKARSPTRHRSRGLKLETELERIAEEEEEQQEKGDPSPSSAMVIGRRLDFGPAAKRRRLEELDARLETLLESLDGKDDENPFWDGPTKAKAAGSSDNAEKSDAARDIDNKESTERRGRSENKEVSKDESTEKAVRIRSPSPPLMSFRGKAPVSPPPSNRRKKKVRGRVPVDTVIEEKDETAEGASAAPPAQPLESTEQPPVKVSVRPVLESSEGSLGEFSVEPLRKEPEQPLIKSPVEPHPAAFVDESATEATVEQPSGSSRATSSKQKVELPPQATEDPFSEPDVTRSVSPMPTTPKKGKKRMDSPIRDSLNNPFLDDSPASVVGEVAEPRTPTIGAEKPTITYLFRGVRVEFANPMYNLPPEVHERSLLPLEHPDYSPDPACPPKRLFSKTRRRQASPSPTRHRGRTNSVEAGVSKTTAPAAISAAANGWNDSDDEAELHVTPPKRLFH